jgi:uncharacterized protein DUF4920
MLTLMNRHVFASVLAVTLATPAFAHDEKGTCDDKHSEAAKAPSVPGTLKPGVVLVRGEPLPENAKLVPVATVLSKPKDGQQVFVEGVVRRACSQMGCWMELAAAQDVPGVRVTFKDYGFFVPTDSAGAKARVQGTVRVAELSAAQSEHLRAEGGSMAAGAQREVRLVATGVELRR